MQEKQIKRSKDLAIGGIFARCNGM